MGFTKTYPNKEAPFMAKKITYRVRNWKDYNRSLISRGNLTIWFSEDAVKSWYQKPNRHRKRGRPFIYSSSYIELALTIRTLFRFPLRATQGFLEGLVSLLGLELHILDSVAGHLLLIFN